MRASSTVEDYLKAILTRQQQGGDGLVATGVIAQDVGVAPGTVTAMMKTLAGSGLATYERYSGVRLTEAGERLALHVLRRHRLIELFLVRIMKMDWSEVHEEAEILEHAFTDRLIERIDALLGYPDVDPHGDPIPSAQGKVPVRDLVPLLESPVGRGLEVARLTDQSRDFLRLMEREGLTPGCRVEVGDRDPGSETVNVKLDSGRRLSLEWQTAEKILVAVSAAAP